MTQKYHERCFENPNVKPPCHAKKPQNNRAMCAPHKHSAPKKKPVYVEVQKYHLVNGQKVYLKDE